MNTMVSRCYNIISQLQLTSLIYNEQRELWRKHTSWHKQNRQHLRIVQKNLCYDQAKSKELLQYNPEKINTYDKIKQILSPPSS